MIRDDDLELLAKAKATGMLANEAVTEDMLVQEDEEFERLTLAERIQHVILFTSFFTLVMTGLPLVFSTAPFIHKLFFFPSSFWLRGIVHRIAGVTLIGVGIFQIFYVMWSAHGNRDFRKIIPNPEDARDAINLFLCNLGLREERPRFGKFNFIEKFEYWALAWGTFVMALTGLMLWFQEASIALFPIWVLDIVRIVHGFEAILAFLAIIIWHMYNVHLNPEVFPMSKVWITGKISREEMMEHHPLEYKEILRERREKVEVERVKALIEEVRHKKSEGNE
ncbi:MAG: cytochrome b/b6 domain-containing protein [Candidatus Lindowbacteria bacterium]|nr:cytochrome b/b6 domain-containing protein [Candidatus Lindowbacteria bacterium]